MAESGWTQVGLESTRVGLESTHRTHSVRLISTSNYSLLRGINTKFSASRAYRISIAQWAKRRAANHAVPRSNPGYCVFSIFHFSLFYGTPLACESSHEHSTSIFTGRGFVRGGCTFSRNMFSRNMFSRNMFSRNMFSRNMFSTFCFFRNVSHF